MDTVKADDAEPLKILLIDDDEDDYIIIKDLFTQIRDRSYVVTWVSTYNESRSFLLQNRHDVCLLDYFLSGFTGIDLLNEIENTEILMPVIFLTGQGEYSVDLRAMKAGAADYLVKSTLTAPLLERAIRYAIERANAASRIKKARDELEDKVKQRTSELREANRKLRRASDKIKSFAYSISHDLKSPSIGLLGLTRRLYEGYGEKLDNKGKLYCEQIRKAGEQIYSLVGMINNYIAAKELPLNLEDINLREILDYIRTNHADQLSERRIKWSVPDTLPVIRADRMCLSRILSNLVENALKYGGQNLTVIEISFEENSQEYILSVTDNGMGLNKIDDRDIFKPFERVGTEYKTEGSGLGLAIVKEMVEKHGGHVWYDSKAGSGIVFRLSIPKCL